VELAIKVLLVYLILVAAEVAAEALVLLAVALVLEVMVVQELSL
jgi:hypothetical protein